jgi:hypothetical protein
MIIRSMSLAARQSEARHRHPAQRAVHWPHGLEQAALPERPGHREARLAAESGIGVGDHQVPALRIVDDGLWQAVQARYAGVQKKWTTAEPGKRFNQFVRPKYLFTGMTKCGECSAGFVVYYRDRLGCFGTRERGTCTNKLTICVVVRRCQAPWPPLMSCSAVSPMSFAILRSKVGEMSRPA